jgi:hypothetical protein
VSVSRYSNNNNNNSNKKRKASSSPQVQSAGRPRYPPGASSRGGASRSTSSSSGRPPSYQHSVGGDSTSGGTSLTGDQLRSAKQLRASFPRGTLDQVADAQLAARWQQQACLLCGKSGHRVQQCPTKRSGQSNIKGGSPKGNARPGQ